MTIDQDKLSEFLGRFVGDLGATAAAGNVVIGHRLGLYRALAEAPADRGGAGRGDPAPTRGTSPNGCAARRRAATSATTPPTGRYSLTEEQAFALTDPDGAVYLPGAFVLALGALRAEPRITEAFRTGAGIGWHEHDEDVFAGCEQFFRPGYVANLVPSWIPALDGVEAKLRAGAAVADVGCGLGASTDAAGPGVPGRPRFTGSDYHDGVDRAWPASAPPTPGVADRVELRGRVGADLLRDRVRPGDHLRLPARHGRPARRGPAHPGGARRRTAPG